MNIIVARPPNFEDIVKVFPLAERASTIFAYDETIYVSEGVILSPAHLMRQREIGVEPWWDTYLKDEDFRYKEELLAHKAEYWVNVRGMSRSDRHRIAVVTTKRLIAPLYKFNVSFKKAYKDITGVPYYGEQ